MASKESNINMWEFKIQDQSYVVKLAIIKDLDQIVDVADSINKKLLDDGFDQWNHNYPNRETFETDIADGTQFLCWQGDTIAGMISINPARNNNFFNADFKDETGNFRVISRLAINPKFQSIGLAGELMKFAEANIKNDNYSSIRLGALKNYSKVVDFYIRRQYNICGEVYIERTNHTYYLMEKLLG